MFVYRFPFVYMFIFCIFCIVKMQESSRQGSLLPPSRWFQWGGGGRLPSHTPHSTSLHPPHALGHTSPRVGSGWKGFREVIVPGSLPPPHRGFPLSCIYFSLVYSYILRLGFSSGFFPGITKRHVFHFRF